MKTRKVLWQHKFTSETLWHIGYNVGIDRLFEIHWYCSENILAEVQRTETLPICYQEVSNHFLGWTPTIKREIVGLWSKWGVQRKNVGGESVITRGEDRERTEGGNWGIRKRNERCTSRGKWDLSYLPDLEDSHKMRHLKETPLNSPAINLTRR